MHIYKSSHNREKLISDVLPRVHNERRRVRALPKMPRALTTHFTKRNNNKINPKDVPEILARLRKFD